MPVFLTVVRMAQCEICQGQWTLQPFEQPEKCIHCGSVDWEWGIPSRDSIFIRQEITRLRRVLNPGARSKKRQDRARNQHQAFAPKPVTTEVPAAKKKPLPRKNRGRE